MINPTPSGNVEAQGDIYAQTINTGHIENHTHLTIKVIAARLEELVGLLQQPEGQVSRTAEATIVATAGSKTLPLPSDLLTAWQLLPRASDAPLDLRRQAYAAWQVIRRPIDPPQEVAAREHYVPLSGRVDRRDMPLTLYFTERRWIGEGPQRQMERIPLADVTEAVDQHPAFVLLGPPGSGKSTVLRRLALEAARAFLIGQSRRLLLRLNLAGYKGERLMPSDFISQHCRAEMGEGDFATLVRAGEMLLLADGFNEMERLVDEGERRRRANLWRDFIGDYFTDPDNSSRLVIASRDQADYDQPLGLPRVEIDPLTEEQIEAFLRAYLGQQVEGAMAALRRLDLLTHVRNPYQLVVLAALYDPKRGDLPPNRGHLFAEYARHLVAREERASHPHWIKAELQLAALGELGYMMQSRSESTLLTGAELLALLPEQVRQGEHLEPLDPSDLFDLACRAGILIPEPTAGEQANYRFSHQLLQEQFAAAELLRRWETGEEMTPLWRIPRTSREMPPAEVGEWDPLPPPPASGWEQTTLMAAGLADRPDAFVKAVLAVNPALAGRCLSEGTAPVSPEVRAEVGRALLSELGDPTLHRRARVQAGRILGVVGDPRFTPQVSQGVKVILPELVHVAGGRATIGSGRWSRQAWSDERPRHQLEVAPFYLARYPVTNAEYACFIKAGGYDHEAYWTQAGWQWRQGELASSGPVEEMLEIREYYLRNPVEIEKELKEGRLMPDVADGWRRLIDLSEAEARQLFSQAYPTQPHDRPYYWADPAYNAPNQPLVGVTWYEAMAYCAWLQGHMMADQGPLGELGAVIRAGLAEGRLIVRLPTEVEWEWAAGGAKHTAYPWGNKFDPERANTLEGRMLRTTPVGAYPAGAAPCGAMDLSGNVWEWTYSLYRGYPYRSGDGREDPLADGRRTLRGGAWNDDRRYARVSARDHLLPVYVNVNIGVRLVVAPV